MHEIFEEILYRYRENRIVPNFTTSGYGMTEAKVALCKKYCGAVAVCWYRSDYTLQAISADRTYLPSGIAQVLASLDFIESRLNVCVPGPSDSGKSYLAKALGISACSQYRVIYFHCEQLLESMVMLKEKDYPKYQKQLKKVCGQDLLILDDFLLHTLTDEREVKLLFEILEKRSEMRLSTFVCSQREPASWSPMILNDEVSANAILKRATKHYTVVIKPNSGA